MRRSWFLLLLAGAITFSYQLAFFDRWFSQADEGQMLLYADILAKGGELYRDATLYPLPGAFYFLSGIFQLVEPSIRVARWLVMLEFTVFTMLLVALLRYCVGVRCAAAAIVAMFVYRIWAFPHWQFYGYSAQALLLLVAAALLLVRSFARDDVRSLALAGFLTGLAVFCKQDYGAAGMLAFCAALAVHVKSATGGLRTANAKAFGWFIGPAALVGGLTALHFLRQGLLLEMLQQTVLNHLVGIATFEYPGLPSLFPLFAQDPSLRSAAGITAYMPGVLFSVDWEMLRSSDFYREGWLWDLGLKAFFFGPYLLLTLGGVRLVRQRTSLADPAMRIGYLTEWVIWALGAVFVLSFSLNRPQDYVHLAILYWPLLALGLVYVDRVLGRFPGWRIPIAALVFLVAVPTVGYSARLVWRIRTVYDTPIENPRSGIFYSEAEAKLISSVVGYVRANTRDDQPATVMPYFPLVTFLADRHGPHRSSYVVWPVPEIPDREGELIRAIDGMDSDIFIYHFTQFKLFPSFDEYVPELFGYLVDHFEIDEVYSFDPWGYMLAALRRTPEAPAGTALVSPMRRFALRIESPDAPPRRIPRPGQGDYVAFQDWPFRPVMALRPSAAGQRTVLSVPLRVEPGARLVSAIGFNARRWFHYPPVAVAFEVAIVAQDGTREIAYSRSLDPHLVLADRGWFPVEIDLAAHAGRRVAVEFSTACNRTAGEEFWMGGWEVPRIVTRASAAAAGRH